MSAAPDPDLIVLGGGPSGAVAAREAARLGMDVAIIERERFPRDHIGEALAPPALRLLDGIGLGQAIRAAGFAPVWRSLVRWGRAEPRLRPGADEPGLVVERARFDTLLLAAARTAGARVIQPETALRPIRRARRWIVPLAGGGELSATLLIDARGRSAGQRRAADGVRTVALHAYWEQVPAQPAEVLVEAGDEAWLWAGRLADGRWSVLAMLDAARCAGLTAPGRTALLTHLVAGTTLLRPILHGRPGGRVTVCDATAAHAPRPVARGRILAGEAALTLDPLSSQGVQAAIVSGLQAAVVASTLLRRPGDGAAAARFYAARIAETAARNRSHAAAAYAAETARQHVPFWRERAVAPEPTAAAGTAIRLARTQVIAGPLIETRIAVRQSGRVRPVAVLSGAAREGA